MEGRKPHRLQMKYFYHDQMAHELGDGNMPMD
jgi:hypothetical protein